MFADTSRSMIYVTTDEGETFRSYSIPVNPRTLKIHPSMPGWILGHDSDQVATVIRTIVYLLPLLSRQRLHNLKP